MLGAAEGQPREAAAAAQEQEQDRVLEQVQGQGLVLGSAVQR